MQSSPPAFTPRSNKRQRSASRPSRPSRQIERDSSPLAGRSRHARRASGSSLPPSSPPPPFSDTEAEDSMDERDAVVDIDDDDDELNGDEEGDGEDLYGDTLEE